MEWRDKYPKFPENAVHILHPHRWLQAMLYDVKATGRIIYWIASGEQGLQADGLRR
jgi:hypothetical protein